MDKTRPGLVSNERIHLHLVMFKMKFHLKILGDKFLIEIWKYITLYVVTLKRMKDYYGNIGRSLKNRKSWMFFQTENEHITHLKVIVWIYNLIECKLETEEPIKSEPISNTLTPII